MTVTFRPAGTPAARRATRRPWQARATIALLLVIGMLLGTAGIAWADTTPSPTPTASGVTRLTLAPVGNGIVPADASLSAWITQQNGTSRPIAESTATLAVGTVALSGREGIATWLSGNTLPDVLQEISRVVIPAVGPGADETVLATVPQDSATLQTLAPGVYPLVARTSGGGVSLAARSVIIVRGDQAASPVGVIVPIAAGPLAGGLLTSDQLAELTAADGLLTGTLDAVAGTSAILAIDPAIPAAIRVLGSAAPETATAWLDRLMTLPNERFALQFGDADVTAQVAAGDPPLQPTTLAPYLDAGDFADLESTTTPAPTQTAAGEIVLPDLATLLDVGPTRSTVYWPVTGTANADVVTALGATSSGSEASLTLVPSDTTDAGANAAAVAASAQAGAARVLVYDSAASEALRDAAVVPESALRAAPLTEATAYLAVATQGADPLLVVVDRAGDYGRIALRAAIVAATQAPGAVPATLAQLVATAPTAVGVTGGAPDPDRTAAASEFIADETSLQSFSSILEDPDALLAPERAEMLQLLGAAWYPEPELWSAAFATHRAETSATLDAVGILPPTTTNLIASGADFGFWVRNDLPWPVNVVLNAQPNDLRLEIARTTEVRAEPASNTRVPVRVDSRVGNGEVTIAVQLTSPSGVTIGAKQSRDVNVRSEVEGLGVVLLSVLIGGLLVLGVVRTVLHRRWLRRQESESEGDAAARAPAGAAAGVHETEAASPYEELP